MSSQLPHSGPIKRDDGYELEVDRDLCVTLAICLGLAPETFELDTEGKAVFKNVNGDDMHTLMESAKGCPVNAIIIRNKEGKRLWPDPEVEEEFEPQK